MPTTLSNIPLETNLWTDLYDESSISVGTRIKVYNTGSADIYIAVSETQPLVDSNSYITLKPRSHPYINNSDDIGLWAISNSCKGEVNVNIDISLSTDYFTEVRNGNVFGERIIDINGANPESGSTISNLWAANGILIYPQQPGEQWEIVFSSPNDTAAGTGAQEVTVRYQDNSNIEQVEVVESNGGTVLMTATNAFRFIELKVTRLGSGVTGKNQGDIDIQVSGGGDPRGKMLTGSNITLHGFYTVPADKKAFIIYGYTGVQKDKDSQMAVFITDGDNGIFTENLPLVVYQNTFVFDPESPTAEMKEKTDLQVTVKSTNNTTKASLYLQIWEVDL